MKASYTRGNPSENSLNFQPYKNTASKREVHERNLKYQRWERSLQVAQNASVFLRKHFQVNELMCFGSILHSDRFTLTSDIDLAAQGLVPDQFFIAVAQLQDLSPEFKIDLVDLDRCRPSLKKMILLEGQKL